MMQLYYLYLNTFTTRTLVEPHNKTNNSEPEQIIN